MKHIQLRRFTGIGRKAVMPAPQGSGHEGLQPEKFSTSCAACGRPAGMDLPENAFCPRCGRSRSVCLLNLKHHLRHWWASMDLKWRKTASQTPAPHESGI